MKRWLVKTNSPTDDNYLLLISWTSLVSFIFSGLFFHLSPLSSLLRLVLLSFLRLVFLSSVFSSLSICVLSLSSCAFVVVCCVLWCCGVCTVVWCDTLKTSPCVHPKRTRLCLYHSHMLKHICAWCHQNTGTFWMYTRSAWVRRRGCRQPRVFPRRNLWFLNMLNSTSTQCQVHASSTRFWSRRWIHVQLSLAREGRIHFHPKSISSTDTFIQTRFHPMTLHPKHFSSNNNFIQWHFQPVTVSSKKSHVVQSI